MKEYLISITALSLACAMIISLVPSSGTSRYLKLLCTLCSIGCIVLPLNSLGTLNIDKDEMLQMIQRSEESENNYDEIYNMTIEKYEKENANIILKNKIIKRFYVNSDSIDVEIFTDENSDEIFISSVAVTIYPKGMTLNVRALEKYIFDEFGCQCEIRYKT